MAGTDDIHAKYSGSKIHRVIGCPGSTRLCASVPPRPSSEYALRGTRAHSAVENALKARCFDARIAVQELSDWAWYQAPDPTEERDDIDSVQEMLDAVSDILERYPDAILEVETRFIFPQNVPGLTPEDAAGKNDVLIYVPSTKTLYVIDYKHGEGVVVEIIDNKQLKFYAVGAIVGHPEWEVEFVSLTIVQPRADHKDGPVRTWVCMTEDVLTFIDDVDVAIRIAEQPDAPLVADMRWCQFCDAAAICPERERMALTTTGNQFASVRDVAANKMPNPKTLDADRISFILQAEDIIKDWFRQVNKHALELSMNGTHIPGFKTVYAQARRRFEGEPLEVAKQLVQLTGATINEVYPRTLIGITEAEKMVVKAYKKGKARGKAKEAAADARQAFAFLTTKDTSGNLTLAPSTDPRPAINPAASAFANVQLPPPPEK